MAQAKTFTGEELVQRIKNKSLAPSLEIVGMVKESEIADHIAFAPTRSCERWIDIPTESIEEAEYVGTQPCKDHSHDLVRLTLKLPKTPEGKVLGQLLTATSQVAQMTGGPATQPPTWSHGAPAQFSLQSWPSPRPMTNCFPFPECPTHWAEWDSHTGRFSCSNCGPSVLTAPAGFATMSPNMSHSELGVLGACDVVRKACAIAYAACIWNHPLEVCLRARDACLGDCR